MITNGYYWVRDARDIWVVAELHNGNWFVPGIESTYNSSDFEEIDEHKIERNLYNNEDLQRM